MIKGASRTSNRGYCYPPCPELCDLHAGTVSIPGLFSMKQLDVRSSCTMVVLSYYRAVLTSALGVWFIACVFSNVGISFSVGDWLARLVWLAPLAFLLALLVLLI